MCGIAISLFILAVGVLIYLKKIKLNAITLILAAVFFSIAIKLNFIDLTAIVMYIIISKLISKKNLPSSFISIKKSHLVAINTIIAVIGLFICKTSILLPICTFAVMLMVILLKPQENADKNIIEVSA